MGQEQNVIGGHSPSLHDGETKKHKWSPTKNEDSNNSIYEENEKLVLDEGPSEMNNDQTGRNEGISGDFNSEMLGLEASPVDPASIYSNSSIQGVQPNQLTPSVSLTPISQRLSGTNTPPIAKHNLPATAMMTSSISPKPLAKKKQSKFTKPVNNENQTSRPVLRPNDMTSGVTCSIHCELASGIPALNCFKCQVP